MSIFIKFFVNQLDELIKQEYSGIDIYNLPVEHIDVKGNVTPLFQTHRNARSKFPWEIDHMFATQDLYNSLTNIKTIKVPQLSDHDPIIATFNIN